MINKFGPFYVSLVSYFQEKLPNRRDSIRMFQLLNIFSEYKCKASFWNESIKPENDTCETTTVSIGDIDLMNQVEGMQDETIFGGGFTSNNDRYLRENPFAYEFYSAMSAKSRWHNHEMLPYTQVSFTCDWIKPHNEELIISTLIDYLEICDKYEPTYCMIDVSHYFSSLCGLAFSSLSLTDLTIDRRLEQHRWLNRIHNNQSEIRGIYWGNYISNRSFSDQVTKTRFIERFIELAKYNDGEANAIIHKLPNGTFFSISNRISDCIPNRTYDLVPGENACNLSDLMLEFKILS